MDLGRFRYYTRWHDHVNNREYDAPADPWKLLRVDPTGLEHYNTEIKLNWGLGRIEAGDWDHEENYGRLGETTVYRGLEQRFEKGYDWEETALYREAEARFEESGTVRGYDSLEEYRSVRCRYVDEVFHSIARDGYRPNEAATHENPAEDNSFEDAYAHYLEPLVVIGRSGRIALAEGFHRTTIASILDLDEIPVYVLCRHEQWQHVRDRVHGAPRFPTRFEAHRQHPDLRDILP
jgi:hypothetical protein